MGRSPQPQGQVRDVYPLLNLTKFLPVCASEQNGLRKSVPGSSNRVRLSRRLGLFAGISKTSAPPISTSTGFPMKRSIMISALVAALSLAACDQGPHRRQRSCPRPAGLRALPAAKALKAVRVDTGANRHQRQKRRNRKTGDTTVIVTPPAEPAK